MKIPQEDIYEKVKREALAAYPGLLQTWFPNGKRRGREFVVGNLNGDAGDSLSINISTGKWSDFETGIGGGDAISLCAAKFHGGTDKTARIEACRHLAEELGVGDNAPAPRKAPPKLTVVSSEEWTPMIPPPPDAVDPSLSGWDHVFTYRDRAGTLLRYVVRNNTKGGKGKEVWPLTYGWLKNEKFPDGKTGWHFKHPNKPRSLYGLERLDGRPVLLFEGEKKCDQVQALLREVACLSLTGGGGGRHCNDLTPLADQPLVTYCGDNDKPGRDVADIIVPKLSCPARLLDVWSHGFKDKWDLGDAIEEDGWTADRLREFLRDNSHPFDPDPGEMDDMPDLGEFDPAQTDDKALEGFARNEDGIALAFAEKFRDRLRYCHTTGAWYIWTGSRWQKEETKLAFCWARDVCRDLNSEGKNVLAKAVTAGAVERFAQADRAFAVTGAIWDRDSFLLGTPGGTVDLKTGLMIEARQEDFMTRQTAVVPADPGNGEGCPQWLDFLHQATKGDDSLIQFMQQIAGYALTGDTREHALFFIYGPGGNGKGVFLNTITKLMADYATTAAMDTFTASQSDRHPTDLAKLKGARLVTSSETEEGRAWAESRIKALTGGDRISARFMRQDFFEFDPAFKLLIVGNHKPILRNVDDAARRRFNIIPFIHKPAQPDKLLEKKLEAEWPAILRWMIDGCLDWQRNGLVRPASVGKATAEYFNSQDLFGQWLEECCELYPGNDMRLETAADLFASWKEFAESNGEHPGNGKALGDKLSQREVGSERRKYGGKTCVFRTGISLVRPPQRGVNA